MKGSVLKLVNMCSVSMSYFMHTLLEFTRLVNQSHEGVLICFALFYISSHLLGPDKYFFTGDDPIYFTIVREPSSVFESLYGYYDFASPQLMNMDIHQYINE